MAVEARNVGSTRIQMGMPSFAQSISGAERPGPVDWVAVVCLHCLCDGRRPMGTWPTTHGCLVIEPHGFTVPDPNVFDYVQPHYVS